jgi:hypothetical protein
MLNDAVSVFGFVLFLFGPPILLGLAWLIASRAGALTRESRAVLAVIAVAGLLTMSSYLVEIVLSPGGTLGLTLTIAIYAGLAVQLLPFVAGELKQ